MGAVGTMRDVIVVGMGPAGAGTAAMLRAPDAFGLTGRALDVLAFEARAATPERIRMVVLQWGASGVLGQADALLGQQGITATAPSGVASIRRIEQTLRDAAAHVGVDARYGSRITTVEDGGRAGVRVVLEDGAEHRARFLVDATGGRLGPFRHGDPTGETIYLTGNLPPRPQDGTFLGRRSVTAHGAGNDRERVQPFGFGDARDGATAFIEYPSMPSRGTGARSAHRLLSRQLEAAGIDPAGLRDAAFIRTPHVRVPSAIDGSMLAVGDSVRRVSPRSGEGVSNSLMDARAAATAIQSTLSDGVDPAQALASYARGAAAR